MLLICGTNAVILSCFQSSVIGSGFGSLNAPKQGPGPDICMSEQLNGPLLPQRTSQVLASSSSLSKDPGQPPMQSPAPAASPTADTKPQRVENGPIVSQNCKLIFK